MNNDNSGCFGGSEFGREIIDLHEVDRLRRKGGYTADDLGRLLQFLRQTRDPREKTAIVRALSLPCAHPTAIAPLLQEYRRAPNSENARLKWSIAAALDIIADNSTLQDLIDLIDDPRNGKSRELLVSAVGNTHDAKATKYLIGLLKNAELAGFAIIGLAKIADPVSRGSIEPFLHHNKTWVRKAAEKAIRRLDNRTHEKD
jgi:HEAT repeat protein